MRCTTLAFAAVLAAASVPTPAAAQYGGDIALLDVMYRRYLGRPADPDGLHTYSLQLRRGVSPIEVEAQLLGSSEFYERWGGSPRGYVRGLYRVVIGRYPNRAESLYWLERYAEVDRITLALDFLISLRQR